MACREEYLKRYLSGSDYEDTRKKRKKKPKPGKLIQPRMRIFDDDITVKDVAPGAKEVAEADLYEEDGPTVVGQTDDRPEEVQQLEVFRDSKQWKTLGDKGEDRGTKYERHDSDSDESPVRKSRHDSDSDESPVRKSRHDSDSDGSLARKHRHSDQPPRRSQRHDSGSDQSPPRKQKYQLDSDQSPPRRQTQGSDSDQSPPRKRSSTKQSEDLSRTSKRQRPSRFEPQDVHRKPDKDESGRAKKTLSGLTAGLSTARAMRMENDAKRRREKKMFDQADEATLGVGAKTVFRDKETGKRRNLAKEGEAEAKENAIKEELLAKYKAWGKGLAQSQDQAQRVAEALHEADKPLARGRGDDDLEDMLRGQERAGDPMLAYVRSKKRKTGSKVKEIPKYKGPQPPANRFNLWPGYRWDGVDRSNGFEKSLFAKRSERKAVAEDAYKWSIEDM